MPDGYSGGLDTSPPSLPFLDLIHTLSDPSSSDALASDTLASAIGIAELPNGEEAITLVEKEILAPVHDLNEGLWRWQVQAPIELPLPPLTLAPLLATHTILPTTRGIDGTFTRWREALAPRPPAHPTLSSSTSRAFGDIKNFVRGKGSYAPFTPGGLEAAATVATDGDDEEGEEEEEEEEEGWKTRAPGLKRGLKLEGGEWMGRYRRSDFTFLLPCCPNHPQSVIECQHR
jgi:antiviral helicase SKI2